MTSVKRPVNLQLGPELRQRVGPGRSRRQAAKAGLQSPSLPTVSSPAGQRSGRLPSQIAPHLYLGAIEQTNRDTLNKLNISYILSLGVLPLVSEQASSSPSSPTLFQHQSVATTPVVSSPKLTRNKHHQTHLPSSGCSRDFRIKLRCPQGTGRLTPTDLGVTQTVVGVGNGSIAPTTTTAISGHQATRRAAEQIPTPSEIDVAASMTIPTTTTTANLNNENHRGALRVVKCKCINVPDNCEASLASFFDETNGFIEEAVRRKCNILVHCRAGVSRSATVAIAYVMRLYSLAMRDAYKLVKLIRPQIDPNLGFIGQLIAYEKIVLAGQTKGNCANNNKPMQQDLAAGQTSPNLAQILGG